MEERWYKDLLPSCSGEFLTRVLDLVIYISLSLNDSSNV